MITIDLSGQIAIVTGGSGDLGRVMCRTLAAAGADVAVHYHSSESKAQDVADEITALGRRAITVRADVTDYASVLAMRDRVEAELGTANLIVNNAVVQYGWKSILDQDLADFDSQYESCVLHTVHMVKAFLPALIERGTGGRVIITNTECAMRCAANEGAYAAGKRGLDGIVRVLAKEVGPHGITVNQVAPGWMESDRVRANPDKSGSEG